MRRKQREYQSSELVQKLAKIYGFDDVLISFKIKDFLREYLDESLFAELDSVQYREQVLTIKVKSPLLRNDFQLRKSFYLKKISENVEDLQLSDIVII